MARAGVSPPLIEYGSREAQAEGLAERVAADLRAALRQTGRAGFAAPGGSTPAAFLAALGAEPLEWPAITVLPGDERWAPPSDERSNEGMIRKALGGSGARILSFWREGETPGNAAPGLAKEVGRHLPLSVAVIGMGADMHCASLFPGGEGLEAALAPDASAVAAITAPGALEPRVTLTLPALAGAGKLYLLITGDEKRAALARALAETDPRAAPVGAVLAAARSPEIHWAP